jgi:hypothetical protein
MEESQRLGEKGKRHVKFANSAVSTGEVRRMICVKFSAQKKTAKTSLDYFYKIACPCREEDKGSKRQVGSSDIKG